MINKISKTEAFKIKQTEEGKVTYLDQPRHIAAINEMNEQLEIARREFQIKERNSQINAAKVILTA